MRVVCDLEVLMDGGKLFDPEDIKRRAIEKLMSQLSSRLTGK